MYAFRGRLRISHADVSDILNATFRVESEPISKSTIKRTVRQFEETDRVKDPDRSSTTKQ